MASSSNRRALSSREAPTTYSALVRFHLKNLKAVTLVPPIRLALRLMCAEEFGELTKVVELDENRLEYTRRGDEVHLVYTCKCFNRTAVITMTTGKISFEDEVEQELALFKISGLALEDYQLTVRSKLIGLDCNGKETEPFKLSKQGVGKVELASSSEEDDDEQAEEDDDDVDGDEEDEDYGLGCVLSVDSRFVRAH